MSEQPIRFAPGGPVHAGGPMRHPAVTGLLRHFTYAHLPAHLQAVSGPVCDLAHQMAARIPDGPELAAGLRKLLEAKDCLVRAALDAPEGTR